MKAFHLNPSHAGRWVHCPGSVNLAGNAIPRNNESVNEGIKAHQVALGMLAGRDYIAADDDMLTGGQIFCDAVLSVCSDLSKIIIEGYVNAPIIHKNNGGVPDAYHFDRAKNEIHIWNYNFGHRYVEEFENWQLINYAAAVIANTNCRDDAAVHLTIVQPRSFAGSGPVRTWKTTKHELTPYFNQLRESALLAEASDALCSTNSYCQGCPAAHCCLALRQSAYIVCDMAGEGITELYDEALAYELQLLTEASQRLQARIDGLTDDVAYRLRDGKQIPGFILQAGQGRETWVKSVDEIIELGALFGVDLSKPGLITPIQARKAGMLNDVVSSLSHRAQTEPKVKAIGKLLSKIFN